jgi:predicted short-subunit dehydrogenase-like oxidoreductase (DUF2520 family)
MSAPDGSARLGSVRLHSPVYVGPRDRYACGVNDDHGGAPGHRHPHPPDDPSGHPRIGFVGSGRVSGALGVAFSRAGWPVAAIATRDADNAARFMSLVPGARAVPSVSSLADDVDLIFVTVPDDVIADVATELRLYAGQAAVHTSGALDASVLEPARAAGTQLGSFHPMVAFASQDAAVRALSGCTIAVEGDEELVALLGQLATDIGAQPVRLPPTGKTAYHAAAVLAGGGVIGLLDGVAEVARGAGLDEAGALAIYVPLIRQALTNAQAMGIGEALTGPFVRGDVGTIRSHLEALRRLAPGAVELYRATASRELDLALGRGAISEEQAAPLRALLEGR